MPKLMNQDTSVVGKTISAFGFSGTKIENLTANGYTLADIEIDLSPSTSGFRKELEAALAAVVDSLNKSPRSENMLVRVETFDDTLKEVHGFVSLKDVKATDYKLKSHGGGTALYDSILCGIEAVGAYGEQLDKMEYDVNGVVFIVTDGAENASSKASIAKIISSTEQIHKAEHLESLKVVLIGIGEQRSVQSYLEQLKKDAKLDQYVWVGDASPSNLAKLADFISRSVSSASQSLGTGGASQNLDF